MHADIIPIKLRYKLFEEKDRHIDGPTIGYRYQLKKGTRYNHWFLINHAYVKNFMILLEDVTAKINTGATPKLADQVVQCMMVWIC